MDRKNFLVTLGIFLFLVTSFNAALFLQKGVGRTTSAPQKSTLGVESYIAQNTCTEPEGGCGSGNYFDSMNCECREHGSCDVQECPDNYYFDSGPCECVFYCPPTDCGTDQYWDSGSCSCVDSNGGGGGEGSCTTPGVCNADSYWDSSSCSCVSSDGGGGGGGGVGGTCTEPAVSCGDGWYWDSSSCTCQTSCPESEGSCSSGTYWSYTACSCVSDCSPPSGGCGNGYWDYGSCSCRFSDDDGSCTEPVGGCGGGFYWESYGCSCKPASACTPPSDGCLENNYWDSYDCSCKASCYEPTGGCGVSTYWDFYQCSCISYDDATYGSGYEGEDFDRLAYESEEMISCIKGILTQDEYEILRHQMGTTEEQRNQKRQLGDKVMSCWGGEDGFESTSGPPSSIEGEKCLVDGMGETAYQEIYQGKREPTHDEHLWFEKCYGGARKDSVSYYRDDQDLPPEVDNCLRSVLVGGLYQEVESGQRDVPSELRGRVDECFGADSQPFEEGRSYELPGEVKSCLIQAVGEARFNEINSGQSEPNNEEMKKGDACFGKLNEDQTKFLPSPSEQVPYLEHDPGMISFGSFEQEESEIEGKAFGGKVVFKGKGPPNSAVTIYIYSEPIVVTTKTDENGDWVYELNQPLEGEKHVAYATVRAESGEVVRSSVFNFEVLAAGDAGDLQQLLDESKVSETQRRFTIYALIIMSVGVVVVFFLQRFGHKNKPAFSVKFRGKKRRDEQEIKDDSSEDN